MCKMIWDLMKEKFDRLPRAQKLVASYMLDNPSESLFMTAQQIGVKSNASEATVFRLATALGFSGFPEFKEALQKEAKGRLSTFGRLVEHHTHAATQNLIYDVIVSEFEKAAPGLAKISGKSVKRLAEEICASDAIYLIGLRSARSFAIYLQYYLSWFFSHVYTPQNDFFENYLASAPKNSLVIGISFPRYTRMTIECVKTANALGLRTAAITDSASSPLAEVSGMCVTVPCVHVAHIDSLMIPFGVANAILIEVAELLGDKALRRLDRLEKIWEENKIYC